MFSILSFIRFRDIFSMCTIVAVITIVNIVFVFYHLDDLPFGQFVGMGETLTISFSSTNFRIFFMDYLGIIFLFIRCYNDGTPH